MTNTRKIPVLSFVLLVVVQKAACPMLSRGLVEIILVKSC